MVRPHRQLEELGMFVHGVLAAFHFLGFVYHARKHHWWDAAIHGGALTYDVISVSQHHQNLSRLRP